jgi:hypothetical protein
MRRRRLMGAVLVLGCAWGGCEVAGSADPPREVTIAEEAAETGVPFELAGPGGAALMVPVYLNGAGPFSFVLDTGATMTCIDEGVALRLELPEAGGQTGVGMGIGQEPGALQLVRLDSIRVGDATATGLTACALGLEQFRAVGLEVDGLLGLNFLREFRLTLDFAAEQLTLER